MRSLILLFVLALLPSLAFSALESTFDTGLDGWRISGDNDSEWAPGGGNPGGCILVNDLATGARNDAVAPLQYLGDWSSALPTDELSFDVYSLRESGDQQAGPYTMRIAGPGGAAVALEGYLPPDGVWTTVTVPLDPAAWVIQGGTWAGILEEVTSLLISAEYVNGAEDTRIDNIRLSILPVPEYSPCAGETFDEGGYLDWTFASTGGVSSPSTGGNSGGYLRIADGGGTSLAFAPSRFLGDWSALDGSGRLTIDLRLFSNSADPEDVAEFIRISGPGGAASVPLAAADLPENNRQWQNYEFPMDQATWTLTEGTWAGLLANVTECRITVEFVDGSEVVGVDNFGRLEGGCPDVDPGIFMESDDYQACGYVSFTGPDAIAIDPVSGHLYVLQDAATSSAGGLYPLTGPGAAIRVQGFTSPADLLFLDDGTLFISEDGPGRIYKYDEVNGAQLWVTGFHSGDDDPGGMCLAPTGFNGPNVTAGDVVVSDFGFSGPDEFWSFSPSVPETELQMVPALPGDPDFREITADPAGAVYAADTLDDANIYRLFPDGSLQAIALSSPLAEMVDLEFSVPEQTLYAVSNTTGTLHRIDPVTGQVDLIASGFKELSYGALAIDPQSAAVFVSDNGANRVYRVCPPQTSSVAEDPAQIISGPSLVQGLSVWPNPASSSSTRVSFDLRREARVEVAVYDIAGRLVRRLVEGTRGEGPMSRVWDLRDGSGRTVPSGVYLMRVNAGQESQAARMVVVR
jgi:DNA-binding beta-propeller fold protein YncE